MARIDSIAKNFVPGEREQEIYQRWVDQKAFHAEVRSDRKPFTIVMPPPNITGQLHIGHALDLSAQDILIRQKRMQGYETLYLPGTDHASIATEAKIVEQMRSEGINKNDLGREAFLERAWAWREQYGSRIVEQSKRLGLSADWERQRFTLDEGLSQAVRKVFVTLYEEGKIYRGERMVNWCPHCHTSISDAEVNHIDEEGSLWTIRYPVEGEESDLVVEVATTRPETLLGDTAVAIYPGNPKTQAFQNRQVRVPLVNRVIPIIEDEMVDPEYGTGAVKITPAHDPNDFEAGLRHNLPVITVIDDNGYMTEEAGVYAGLSILEARKKIVADLEAQGLLVKKEPLTHAVGHCYRCGTVIEPRISLQWFVKMEELAKPAIEAVRDHSIHFIPERFEKLYFNWMENIHDWCISRQLWWGHRIPAWYCQDCGKVTVSDQDPTACCHCGSHHVEQDPDTLDTWFSSALWPFSTLGWPEKTDDLEYFYPTNVLVTGYDIITFWVSRMIFSGLAYTHERPFQDVFLHGLVRDEQGRKMSKSLGNGVDPLELINQYGADALRFALHNGSTPGNDTRYSPQRMEAARNFINKLWNAFRFTIMNYEDEMNFSTVKVSDYALEDRWILTQLQDLIESTTKLFENYDIGIALGNVVSFLWDQFCDWYIEMVKPRLREKNHSRLVALSVLNQVLVDCVKLLHPYMPFVTEDIYGHLIHEPGDLITASWPEASQKLRFTEETQKVSILMEAIRKVRNIRSEMNVEPKRQVHARVVSSQETTRSLFQSNLPLLKQLAQISSVETLEKAEEIPLSDIAIGFEGGQLFMPLGDLIDLEAEKRRLTEEIVQLRHQVDNTKGKLSNESFVAKAPAAVVQKEKDKLDSYLSQLQDAENRLADLQAEA